MYSQHCRHRLHQDKVQTFLRQHFNVSAAYTYCSFKLTRTRLHNTLLLRFTFSIQFLIMKGISQTSASHVRSFVDTSFRSFSSRYYTIYLTGKCSSLWNNKSSENCILPQLFITKGLILFIMIYKCINEYSLR